MRRAGVADLIDCGLFAVLTLGSVWLSGPVLGLVVAVEFLVVLVVGVARSSTTPGHSLMGVRLVGRAGGPPALSQATQRAAILVLLTVTVLGTAALASPYARRIDRSCGVRREAAAT